MAIVASDVRAIIDCPSSLDLTSFIATAQLIVDEDLVDSGLSADRKDQIVLYLAAHFVCLKVEMGGLRRDKLGDADQSFKQTGDRDTGYAYTRYGQQALILDSSGTLSAESANKGLKALFEVV
jgi:hypothetical protein